MDVDKPQYFSRGYMLSFLVIGIAMFGWLYGFSYEDRGVVESIAVTLAKIGAFGGLAMFAWSLILSGRYKIFDTWFRGQDKVYSAHRFFGTTSVVLLVIHPIALVIARIPLQGITEASSILVAFNNTAILLGMVSLYGLIGLVAWSLNNRASYETFIWVHKLLGLFFVAGVSHAVLSGSVLATNDFMFWYVLALSVIASLTFLHYSLLADILHPHFAYKVTSIKHLPGNITDITMAPKFRHIHFRPGQYVYLYAERLNRHGYHPFTIASGYRSSELQFYIRGAGDFSSDISKLRKGDKVRIKGPYGGFTFDDKRYHKQLWIAGGIGITPFLSKARSLQRARRWPEIELVYAIKDASEAFAVHELDEIEYSVKRFNYSMLDQVNHGTKSLLDLVEHFGAIDDCAIYICGPPAMLVSYAQQAEALGLSKQFYFEEFSFK
jgi:predicted ferric reductase